MTHVFTTLLIQLMIAMFYNPIWSQYIIGMMLTICYLMQVNFIIFFFACKNNLLSSNVHVTPDLTIINQHDNIKDLGILMSSDCSFEKHILSVSSRCSSLAVWILRTFAPRDKITMLTLFKSSSCSL